MQRRKETGRLKDMMMVAGKAGLRCSEIETGGTVAMHVAYSSSLVLLAFARMA